MWGSYPFNFSTGTQTGNGKILNVDYNQNERGFSAESSYSSLTLAA
jgi:hypothetical protein